MSEESVSPKKRRAIIALLSEPTLELAARAAGCGSRTLKRWKAEDPAFRTELARASDDAYAAAVAGLRALSGEAVEALRSILRDPQAQAAARVAAARTVLERADPQRGAIRAELAVEVRDEDRAAALAAELPTEVLRELDALAERLGDERAALQALPTGNGGRHH